MIVDSARLNKILEGARGISDEITGTRRALHRIPERGMEEHKTQAYIMAELKKLEIWHEPCLTGVVGYIAGARPGRCVALRADIDALPVTEPEGPFRSEHPGWMHACGHDAHTAILLGAARLINDMRGSIAGSVKLIFQPAEESVGGAEPMIREGVLAGPDVDVIYGLHVQPGIPCGRIETRPGALNASSDEVEIAVYGRGGHGAYPDKTVDAIVCAAQIITALQTLVSRNVSPFQPAVLTLGAIHGGSARNIVCGEVKISGTLRTLDPGVREMMHARIGEVARGVSGAMGCRAEVVTSGHYAALINSDEHAEKVLRLAANMLGGGSAGVKDTPSMGGEDFSAFLERVPGAYYHLGCSRAGGDPKASAPLHSEYFYIDESCLNVGAAMHAALVMDEIGFEEE